MEPRDDLIRAMPGGIEFRASDPDAGDGTTLFGHFARFNSWTIIDSWFEGRFLEQLAPGAFRKTIRERGGQVKVQFDHGHDPFVGGAPLGPIRTLREDDDGVYYEVPLLDTDYNRDRVLPLLRGTLLNGDHLGSLLGASFRFSVVKEKWVRGPKPSEHNPDGLDERTITEVKLYEFGPVVFPAYGDATAAARSLTADYLDRRRSGDGQPQPPSGTGASSDEPTRGHSGGIPLSLAIAQRDRLSLRKR